MSNLRLLNTASFRPSKVVAALVSSPHRVHAVLVRAQGRPCQKLELIFEPFMCVLDHIFDHFPADLQFQPPGTGTHGVHENMHPHTASEIFGENTSLKHYRSSSILTVNFIIIHFYQIALARSIIHSYRV